MTIRVHFQAEQLLLWARARQGVDADFTFQLALVSPVLVSRKTSAVAPNRRSHHSRSNRLSLDMADSNISGTKATIGGETSAAPQDQPDEFRLPTSVTPKVCLVS